MVEQWVLKLKLSLPVGCHLLQEGPWDCSFPAPPHIHVNTKLKLGLWPLAPHICFLTLKLAFRYQGKGLLEGPRLRQGRSQSSREGLWGLLYRHLATVPQAPGWAEPLTLWHTWTLD